MANNNAEILLKERIEIIKRDENKRIGAMNRLKTILGINKVDRIELFDNSHLFGTYYVGAMVVFSNFLPDRKEYRKYKLDLTKPDDLEAMHEVIYRRYYRVLVEDLPRPDLIVVDGGETQIKVTKQIIDDLHLMIPVVGLKKDDTHRTRVLIDGNLHETDLKNDQELFIYLAKMQEEVHRFAITYHKDIKSKGALASVLDNVTGIGAQRRRMLLTKYGSLEKIKTANLDDLVKIIPKSVASSLQEYLNKL